MTKPKCRNPKESPIPNVHFNQRVTRDARPARGYVSRPDIFSSLVISHFLKVSSPPEEVQIRIQSPSASPTLIYFPGLHGDWTLIGGFCEALNGRARFVEITYPRTLMWSLNDYAAGIEEALAKPEGPSV